jgi:hypothetical protein
VGRFFDFLITACKLPNRSYGFWENRRGQGPNCQNQFFYFWELLIKGIYIYIYIPVLFWVQVLEIPDGSWYQAGFLIRILWCSQSGNHSQNNLAKFGCILYMKVEKKTESFYILAYLLELIIKIWWFEKNKSSKFGKFGSFFSTKKILCIGWNHIFQVKFGENLLVEETLVSRFFICQFG